jgi:mannose-6-phosphate isomerase-like protein (cupin superfamily)/GNAT superfamily N-acetyltransferase
MQVRLATVADVPALDAIALAAKADSGYDPGQVAAWAPELRTDPRSLAAQPAWVLEAAGEVVAFCQLDPGGSPWRLVSLFVAPGRQRRGLGSRLVELAAGLARAAGERFLAIDADPRAEAFYRGHGAWAVGALVAPISGEPARLRPQLLLPVEAPAAPATATVATTQAVRAPDGSVVHPLLRAGRGSLARFALAPGQTSRAVRHRHVEELWYVLAGRGQMWRRQGDEASVVTLMAGTALSIPPGTAFQFRADANESLLAIGVTMPPWPGDDEACAVDGPWSPEGGGAAP